MQTSISREIGLVLTIAALLLVAFTCTAAPAKLIPPDEANPRLQTILQELSCTAQARPLALSQLAQDRGITLAGGDSITVIIEPVSGNASRIDRAMVRALGGTIEATSKSLLRVRVPINRLEAMANQVNGIAFIRLPYRPRPLVVTSEGVALTGASDFHTAGYYGQGTKVAIIDLGFIGLTTAQAAGELDNIVHTYDYTGDGLETYTEHGTGVAEIVADMAPQASLYLLMIGDSVDLQNATDYCITNGIDIINHSVGWYNSNYYDGTGTVAGIANNARDNGILWVNAAGNEATDGHWQGTFVDADGDRYLDFGSGSDYLDADAIDEGNRIYASAGDTIYIYMTWDDWYYTPGYGSDQDYDLHLYNSFGAIVASSTNYQNGTQQPTETLVYNVANSGNYEIVIENYNASTTPNIEFFAFTDRGANLNQQYHHSESTIITPANSAKVLTAGAISYWNWTTGPQEYFSSQGPSNASKYAVSITKPDVMGPDRTSSYTYGSFPGTSAASPHVAGAAALLLSEDPTRTANQLQAKLEGDAIDMGTAGKDNLYGSGRLSLQITPTDPLRGHWAMDEGSGSVALDSSGRGHNGTIYGASYVAGQSGMALSFDGVNDDVRVPSSGDLEPANELTLDLWVRFDEIGDDWIVDKSSDYLVDGYRHGYLLRTDWPTDTLIFRLGNGSTYKDVTASIAVGIWYHVVAVYDGAQMHLYLNDVPMGTASLTGPISYANTGDLVFGGMNGTGQYMRGTLDEVKVYSEAVLPGDAPPVLVQDFAASDGEDGQSMLSWTNPSDGDLAQVVVKRKTGSYPSNHTDGTTVYDNASPVAGASATTTDTGLTNGTPYYYAVFSRDTNGSWNDVVVEGSNADSGTPSLPPPAGLMGHWAMDEGSGSVALDSSGRGHNGTIYGASYVAGQSGMALSFDGVNDDVRVPSSGDLEPANELTLDLWVRFDEIGDDWIVDKSSDYLVDGYRHGYLLRTDWPTDTLIFRLGNGSTYKDVTASIAVGIWYHVVAVYDGAQMHLYLNDVPMGTASLTGPISYANTGDLVFGGMNGTGQYMRGTLDEVKVYSEAVLPGDAPPVLVQDFAASDGEDGQSMLSWTNPSDGDLAQVVVKRKTGSYPSNHTDGTTVYDNASPVAGASATTTDTGLTNGTPYYYAVFSRDTNGSWNDVVVEGSNADSGTPSLPPPAGLMGHWAMDEGSGSVALDSSGRGHNGTIYGASYVAGQSGMALSFDGVNDDVRVPSSGDLEPANELTLDLWVRFDEIGDDWIVDKSSDYLVDGYRHGYLLRTDWPTDTLIFRLGNGSTYKDVTASIAVGIWYHVVAVYDGAQMHLYLNDVPMGTASLTGPISYANTGDLVFGGMNGTGQYMRGTLDEVKVYSEAVLPNPLAGAQRVPRTGGRLSARVRPNPVSDVALFEVLGADIKRVRVQIWDLAGKLLFVSGWWSGNQIDWNMRDDDQRELAAGVYLYRMTAEIEAGTVLAFPLQKLFILP